MGSRAFIQIDSEQFDLPVLLYGHYSGDDNLTAVRNVLGRTGRIGDPSYLTAQLFFEFALVLGQYDGELSFGISTGVLSEFAWQDVPAVYVNADTGEYRYEGVIYDEFTKFVGLP